MNNSILMNQPQDLGKKALVFSPHPDDHICCAGTLMFLKDKGFEIHEVVATRGEQGAWWVSENERKTNFDTKELQEVRENEISKASKIIGIGRTDFLGLTDSKIVWDFETIDKIIRIIRKERPQIVFFSNPFDYHSDHKIMSQMVKEAIGRSAWNNRSDLGEPHKVDIPLCMEGMYFGKSHILVDITLYWERKKTVIDVYASQIFPGERRLLESMNFYRGFYLRDHSALAAEAFEILEEYPISFNKLVEIFNQ